MRRFYKLTADSFLKFRSVGFKFTRRVSNFRTDLTSVSNYDLLELVARPICHVICHVIFVGNKMFV